MNCLLEEEMKPSHTNHYLQARQSNRQPHLYLIQALDVTKDLFCGLMGFVKGDYSAMSRLGKTIKEQGSDQRTGCLLSPPMV